MIYDDLVIIPEQLNYGELKMPELPEIENYKILLNQKVDGKTITGVLVNREKSTNVSTNQFINIVQNQEIESIDKRAKHIFFHLKNSHVLLLHLMLGGWMFYGTEDEKSDRTVQIQLSFGDQNLYFIGLRLGYLHLFSRDEAKQELADLGSEPLDANFSLDSFLELIEDRRGKLKTSLVNQELLSGVGNRYSDEIAWYAKLLPERNMNELNDSEKVQLYKSICFIQYNTQLGKDRHANIVDDGYITETQFNQLINTPQLKDIPFILETPKNEGITHKEEIQQLQEK